MGILKNRLTENFSTIPNGIITDTRLSTGARILYCYLASKPDNWKIWNNDIKKSLGISNNHTIAKYFKELLDTGWINRTLNRSKDSKNLSGGYDYELLDVNCYFSSIHENRQFTQNSIHNNTNLDNNTNYIDELENLLKKRQQKKKKEFTPPTLEEVKAYCEERKNNVDAKRFIDYYSVDDWKDKNGKPVRNWKQKMISVWEKGDNTNSSQSNPVPQQSTNPYKSYEELVREQEENQRRIKERMGEC
jgi:hypothetical protein